MPPCWSLVTKGWGTHGLYLSSPLHLPRPWWSVRGRSAQRRSWHSTYISCDYHNLLHHFNMIDALIWKTLVVHAYAAKLSTAISSHARYYLDSMNTNIEGMYTRMTKKLSLLSYSCTYPYSTRCSEFQSAQVRTPLLTSWRSANKDICNSNETPSPCSVWRSGRLSTPWRLDCRNFCLCKMRPRWDVGSLELLDSKCTLEWLTVEMYTLETFVLRPVQARRVLFWKTHMTCHSPL